MERAAQFSMLNTEHTGDFLLRHPISIKDIPRHKGITLEVLHKVPDYTRRQLLCILPLLLRRHRRHNDHHARNHVLLGLSKRVLYPRTIIAIYFQQKIFEMGTTTLLFPLSLPLVTYFLIPNLFCSHPIIVLVLLQEGMVPPFNPNTNNQKFTMPHQEYPTNHLSRIRQPAGFREQIVLEISNIP